MARLHIGNRSSLFGLLSCFHPHHCRGATTKEQKEHERQWDEGRKSPCPPSPSERGSKPVLVGKIVTLAQSFVALNSIPKEL